MRMLLLLLLFSSLTSCGDNQGVERPDAPLLPDAPQVPVPPSLQELIDDAVDRITADTCFMQPDTSGCQWADYTIRPSHFNMAVSTNEAILVIDDFAEGTYPQLVRYRNRILGFYRVNGQNIELQELSVRLPKALGDSLISLAGPEFIPANLLATIGQAAGTAYRSVPLVFLGHGGIVFSHLAELAPEQPLVLLHLAGLFKVSPSLCQGVTSQSLDIARAHFEAIADSLRQVISQHHVRFINASFGDTRQTVATDWSQTCNTPVPSTEVLRQLLHLYDPVYAVLFNTPDVITAHAAANLGDPADFPFDQVSPSYGNRARIGFISSMSTGLDALGRGTVQKTTQFPKDGDADVYVSWNCVEFVGCANPHYELSAPFGLGTFSMPLMTTSYVTPLGLGRLINLRYGDHGNEPMNNSLIQALREELTPSLCGPFEDQPCVYQDPIAHDQLEVYRQGYK
jgi:hypothetical protein